jgi:hypothetical protein
MQEQSPTRVLSKVGGKGGLENEERDVGNEVATCVLCAASTPLTCAGPGPNLRTR